MKNFYPIYKSKKLLPWIKWWLIKGNKVMPKVLSEVIEGTTPITIEGVYKGTSLQQLIFKGQTSQTGTPTPEAPIPVNVVKGNNTITINDTDYQVNLKSKNLFDKTTIVAGDIKGSASSTRLSSRQVLWLDVGTYTMSTNAISPFRYAVSVQNVGVPPLSAYPTYILDSGWITGNTSYTFTLSTAGYFVLALSKTSGNITVEEVADFEYQLEEASEATTYEPYYNYELCKIGDYQDIIYKENDKWYVDKYVGKILITPDLISSFQNIKTISKEARVTKTAIGCLQGNIARYFCDSFNYILTGTWNNDQIGIFSNSGSNNDQIAFRIPVDSDKTFFNSYHTTLYYQLAESTTTEITETNLIEQLEAIKNATLISGTNEITQRASDLPFILNFKYYMKG